MQVSKIADFDTHAVIGGGAARAFQISQTAEFFTVLSNTLYQHKKLAVVREVLCNSWDAHISAGRTNVPVEVTVNDKELIFKDHGPGISDDLIAHIYCNYGNSTKTQDDSVTGGFGLGSKAPFAYTDFFTVTSCYQGLMSVYSVSRGGVETNGVPEIRRMMAVPTDQSGVTVTIPMKTHRDRGEFEVLIETIAKNGEMHVLLNGYLINVEDLTVARQTGFYLKKILGGYTEDAKFFVHYGAVVYEISSDVDELKGYLQTLKNRLPKCSRLILFVKPGAIGVTPSREALSYNESTRAELVRMLVRAQKMIRGAERQTEKIYIRERLKVVGRANIHAFYNATMIAPTFGDTPLDIARMCLKGQCDQSYHVLGWDKIRKEAMTVFREKRSWLKDMFSTLDVMSQSRRYEQRLLRRMISNMKPAPRLRTLALSINHEGTPKNTVYLAPTQQTVIEYMRRERIEEALPCLIHANAERLEDQVQVLCDRFKYTLVVIGRIKVEKPKAVETTWKILHGRTDEGGNFLPTTRQPDFYLTGHSYQKDHTKYVSAEAGLAECRPLLKALYPEKTFGVSLSDRDLKLYQKAKVPHLLEVLMKEIAVVMKRPGAGYWWMHYSGWFYNNRTLYERLSNPIRNLCKADDRIAQIFFPARGVNLTERERDLVRVLVHIAGYSIREDIKGLKAFETAAREKYSHLAADPVAINASFLEAEMFDIEGHKSRALYHKDALYTCVKAILKMKEKETT